MAESERTNEKVDIFKVLLVGDSGVGKTEIIAKLCTIRFEQMLEGPKPRALGVDFVVRSLEVDGHRVKLQVWDTAGQERFKSITTAYYRGACAVVLVYDVRCRRSFLDLENWVKDVHDNCHSNPDVVKLMVGHYDQHRDAKEVPTEEAEAFARQHDIMELFEIGSEDSEQVERFFLSLTQKMLMVRQQKQAAAKTTDTEIKCSVIKKDRKKNNE